MVADGIDAEADDLRVALVELRLELGHVAQLGGADRGEILGMGEQDAPAVAEPLMEADLPLGGILFEIWGGIAKTKGHVLSPPMLSSGNGWADACLDRALEEP